MKHLLLLTAFLTVSASYPLVKTWSLSQLSESIETNKDPTLKPYLEKALNQIMLAIFTGNDLKLIQAAIPSPSGSSKWTVEELTNAAKDFNLPNDQRLAAVRALATLTQGNATGEILDAIEVVVPAMDVSLWSSIDLKEALRSPNTKPELIPYLEKAYKEMKKSLDSGNPMEVVGMVTPVGLVPHMVDYEFLPKASKHLIKKTKKVF